MRGFDYVTVRSVDEAVHVLAAAGPGAKYLAGGTTLYDLMKTGIERPPAVVDVTRIAELHTIDTENDPNYLVFGGGAHMSDVAADPVVVRDYPVLSEALWRSATQQLRNMATLGGLLLQRTRCTYFRGEPIFPCNKREPGSGCAARGGFDRGHAVLGTSDACVATYAGDFPVAALAFDALVDVVGLRGARTIPLADLHVEPGEHPEREHTLAPDELIVRLRIPRTEAGRISTYLKIRDRESYAFALTSAAVGLVLDGEVVTEARIGLGGVATRPWRATEAERALVGRALTEETRRQAGAAAFGAARPGTYNAFKIELGVRTVAEALRIAVERRPR